MVKIQAIAMDLIIIISFNLSNFFSNIDCIKSSYESSSILMITILAVTYIT